MKRMLYLVSCMMTLTLVFLASASTNYSKEQVAEVSEKTLVMKLTAPNRPAILAPAFDGQLLKTVDISIGASSIASARSPYRIEVDWMTTSAIHGACK